MSTATRSALASAASTVQGISVSPHFTQTTRPGSGWVRLDRTAYDFTGAVDTWQVVLILPADTAQAERWIDNHRAALVAALRDEMTVREAQPVQMTVDQGQIPALIFTGTRETEETP